MLSGLAASALAIAGPVVIGDTALPPLTDEQRERISVCAQNGETLDAMIERSTIINATGMKRALALELAIKQRQGERLIIVGGDFAGQNMRRIAPLIAGACVHDSDFSQTNWDGTVLSDVQFDNIVLDGVSAKSAQWTGVKMRGVSFPKGDFTGADLARLNFTSAYTGADFDGVSFRAADLTEARFECGITVTYWCLNGPPDFTGAILKGADVTSFWFSDAGQLQGANLDQTLVSPRTLASLEDSMIKGPLVLKAAYAFEYEGYKPATATLNAEEARTLIAAAKAGAEDTIKDEPSFDCAKAATKIETMICGEYDSELRALDRELASAWKAARAAGKASLSTQRRWLRSRNACDDRTCLSDVYEDRIAQLRGTMGPGLIIAPDQTITYKSDAMPLPEASRSGEIYERILPVLVESSWQTIELTGREDGTVSATGDAVGGNAHTCGMNVPTARFDPKTGWWSATNEETGALVPLFRVEGRKIHMRYSGNLGNTPEEVMDMVSCGARAGFSDGIDLSPR